MREVFITTWVNPNDGDFEMYVAETRELANEFSSDLKEEGIDCKVTSRPVQDESIYPGKVCTSDYFEEMGAVEVADYSGRMFA